ncbi:bifunctional 4-hydroxy-2-oxoglutarate aldolase/2-dehydro-3-deoxy-phosphogluconate aldolase [Erysipelotrichaceae bacterium RD49]|nr:bifunctional 4-hydroxy-2-oxoglutarate aldolase/2-dehydro-3-deoxy-phosphogluconate aldolase [Erysipelotrichaceae bacterium RD49]
MNEVLKRFQEIGIVPVVVLDDAKDAVPLGNALVNGGLPAAEVTFRTAAAKDSIAAMRKSCPDLLVGAGTVLTTKMVDDAIEAGAQFIVSPGFDEEVTKYCIEKGIPVTPGCCTPTDVQACYKLGLDVVKFFPAEPAGGLKMIKAIAAPYNMLKFMPTGGISEKNMEDYLKEDVILCIGGSWMVKKDMINNGEFDKIEELCRKAAAKRDEVRKNG